MFPSEDIARALSDLEKRIERLGRLDQVFTINAGETVINEAGIDRNLRIEGVGELNLLFVDAGANRIGFGTAAPGARLEIAQSDAQGIRWTRAGHETMSIDLVGTNRLRFRNITDNREDMVIADNGRIGMGLTVGMAGQLHIDQSSLVAAIPTLVLDQADISEGFVNFIGSDRGVITSATSSLASVRAELGGVVYRLALYVDA